MCLATSQCAGEPWCPQERPALLAGLLFSYANSLLKKGSVKHLEQDDLWDVATQHRSAFIYSHFQKSMARTANPNRFPHVCTSISSSYHPRVRCCLFSRCFGHFVQARKSNENFLVCLWRL